MSHPQFKMGSRLKSVSNWIFVPHADDFLFETILERFIAINLIKSFTKSVLPPLGVNDTPVFLLNEYIVELNPANFNILNQILNWIFLNFFKLNNFLNLIFLNWIIFWIEFCPNFSYWIFYGIEFCPEISYWIESGWKTENQLYFESILWYYTLKYPKNTPKCLIMP